MSLLIHVSCKQNKKQNKIHFSKWGKDKILSKYIVTITSEQQEISAQTLTLLAHYVLCNYFLKCNGFITIFCMTCIHDKTTAQKPFCLNRYPITLL